MNKHGLILEMHQEHRRLTHQVALLYKQKKNWLPFKNYTKQMALCLKHKLIKCT